MHSLRELTISLAIVPCNNFEAKQLQVERIVLSILINMYQNFSKKAAAL
jgi:hypothetical protein